MLLELYTVREEDRSKVNIIMRVSRAVDDYGSKKPSGVLCRVVGMVP